MAEKLNELILTPQKHIYIIASGYGCSESQLQMVVQILKQEFPHYIIHAHEDLLATDIESQQLDLAFSANTAIKRASVIIATLNSIALNYKPENQYILWCLTGGEGSPETIEELEKNKKEIQFREENNKNVWIIGFSDSTSLLNYLGGTYHIRGLYGPDLLNLCDIISPGYKAEATLEEEKKLLKKIIFKQKEYVRYEHLQSLNITAKLKKSITGYTLGGLLTSLYGCLGTFWEIKTQNAILFIEGVIEPFELLSLEHVLYHPRFLQLIMQSKAIVFGDISPFSLKKPLTQEDYTDVLHRLEYFAKFIDQYNIPVYFGLPCGHTGTRSVGYSGKSLPVFLFTYTEITTKENSATITFYPYADLSSKVRKKPEKIVVLESPLNLKCEIVKYRLPFPIYLHKANSFDFSIFLNRIFSVTGGNLRTLHERIITPYNIQPWEKILLIEYNEHKKIQASALLNINVFLRRTLMHFYQSGLFNGIQALIIGKVDSFYNPKIYLSHLLSVNFERFADQDNIFIATKRYTVSEDLLQQLEKRNYIRVERRRIKNDINLIVSILDQIALSDLYHQELQKFFLKMIRRFCRERNLTIPTMVADYYKGDLPSLFSMNSVVFYRCNNQLIMRDVDDVNYT